MFNPLFYLKFKSKARLRPKILVLNFVSDLAQVGQKRHIASCNILAVNNNPLKDFFRDFRFVIKISSYSSTCTARKPRPLSFKLNNLFNEHFPHLFF